MKLLITSVILSALAVAHASADEVLDQLLACRRVPDSTARLQCFDRAADAETTAKTPDVAESPAKPTKIQSSIVRMSQPVAGRADFTLENGQVWRQMDADHAGSAHVGDRVVISKVFLGAHWMKIEGGHEWRVTLVRQD